MRIYWTSEKWAITHQQATRFSIDPATGKPLLAFSRRGVASPTIGDEFVIAEADGQVRNAIFLEFSGNDCNNCVPPMFYSLGDGLFSFDMRRYETCPAYESAQSAVTLSGAIGEVPIRVIDHPVVEVNHGLGSFISSRWLVERDFGCSVSVLSRASGTRQMIFAPGQDPDGLEPSDVSVTNQGVFFDVHGGGNSGVMSWDPENGTRPLLRWYGDFSRGAGNFATDGEVMVWTQGEGKPVGGWYDGYTTISVMTAPFTTDPNVLQQTARRLSADPGGALVGGIQNFVIGCGYAAHRTNDGLFVIRLSDGYSWLRPSHTDGLSWPQTLGLTCDEVFGLVSGTGATGVTTIGRLRLDSLGEPVQR